MGRHSKLSSNDRRDIITMRKAGSTLQSIADKYHISKEYVRQINASCKYVASQSHIKKIIYPALKIWLLKHDFTIADLADLISGCSYSTVWDTLVGRVPPTSKIIIELMKATGMSFEDIFGYLGCYIPNIVT